MEKYNFQNGKSIEADSYEEASKILKSNLKEKNKKVYKVSNKNKIEEIEKIKEIIE